MPNDKAKTEPTEPWEKMFDEKFDMDAFYSLGYDSDTDSIELLITNIKDFIRQAIAEAVKQEREKWMELAKTNHEGLQAVIQALTPKE